MSMMENAITSIELGVEDFEHEDPRRLTSAIRNLAAGLLLLFKCVLADRSPPGSDGVLIYQRLINTINPDGSVTIKKVGTKTVDVQTIKERIEALGLVIDWAPLDTVIEIRNEIEHFHTDKPDTLVREALSAGMPLIQEVLGKYLGESAADVFSPEIWTKLIEIKAIFDAELAVFRTTFDAVEWDSDVLVSAIEKFRCPHCNSPMVRQVDPDNTEFEVVRLECVECREQFDLEDILEGAIEDATSFDSFIAAKDGGEPPIYRCPECNRMTYSLEDGRCLMNCGVEADDLVCSVCNTQCTPDDYNAEHGMCSYHAWTYNKMMEED